MSKVFIFLCLFFFGMKAIANTDVNCEPSKEVLPETPQDVGARNRTDILQYLISADLFDPIMLEDVCDRTGSILLAITIAPDGRAIKVRKLGSTFTSEVVEDYLLTLIPNLNFGEVEGQGYSVVYVPFVFQRAP